jgi:exoribonuclease R
MESIGIITYNNDSYFVNDNEIKNMNNGILGDKVKIDESGNVIQIYNHFTNNIVGILKLSSRVKYGFNKRGIPIYVFKPYHNKYPNFLVCSRSRNKRDLFCTIQYNKFDKIKEKHFGKLKEILGEVNDYNNQIKYLLTQYYLNYPINKKIIKEYNLQEKIDLDLDKNIQLQNKQVDYEVVSIDPYGCKDVDDTFHFVKNNNSYEIGIHIADILFYFNEKMNNIVKNRFFTIYYDDGKNNMLPDIYSENLISLIENQNRYAISVIYTYNKNKLIKTEVRRSIVKNKKQFTYNEVDDIFRRNRYKNRTERVIIDLKKFMENELDYKDLNSHNLIEYFMIKTNEYVGNLLFDNFGEKILMRKHEKIENKYFSGNDSELKKFLKLRMMKKAIYSFADTDKNNNYHFGLNLKNYVHFTSPIRRYNDIIIHSYIYKYLNIDIDWNNIIDDVILNEMNEREKLINKCERKLNRLKLIKELEILNQTEKILTHGYITEINDRYIYIYIPKYKLEEKIRLIPQKFKQLYKYIINDDNSITIFKDDNLNDNYKLYEKINIEIIPFLNEQFFQNKIKISIIN